MPGTKKASLFFMVAIAAFCLVVLAQDENDQKERLEDELFEALEKGNGELARKLLDENSRMVTAKKQGGWTVLHMCAQAPLLTEYLIKEGADVHATSGGGWTPLHSHAYYGSPEGIKALIKHGARVNQKNAFGMTPVMNTVRWNKYENLTVLAQNGADLNVTDSLGRTPLINASIQGFSRMTATLLEKGADISISDLPTKRTALHFASLYGHREIVEQLLAKGADVQKKDSYGKEPLYYAIRYGHRKVAQFLKSVGAEGEIGSSGFGPSPVLKKELSNGEASVWFLGRIGFAVKTRNHFLVFSYYNEGNLPTETSLSGGYLTIDEMEGQNVTVFAASDRYHHHNPKQYSMWQKELEHIRFVYSFEDKAGTRNPHYLEDVPGPDYIYLPGGVKREIGGLKVESIVVPARGTGFLVEVDGLVICHTGDTFVFEESQMEGYEKTVQYLKNSGEQIDLLFQMGVFPYGRIVPANVQALHRSLKLLKPRSLFLMGGQHCEYLLEEVKESLKEHEASTEIFAPQHQGDRFEFKK